MSVNGGGSSEYRQGRRIGSMTLVSGIRLIMSASSF